MFNFVFLIGANKNNIDNDDDDVVKTVVMSINALAKKKISPVELRYPTDFFVGILWSLG